MPVNSKQAYKYFLNEIAKLGSEDKMRSMLSHYMLDPKDDDFLVQLGVCLITEMRQELEKGINCKYYDADISTKIEKRVKNWNLEEIRNSTVRIKTSQESGEEKEEKEERKEAKEAEIREENEKRKRARKSKSTNNVTSQNNTKVIGSVGGYTLESVKS